MAQLEVVCGFLGLLLLLLAPEVQGQGKKFACSFDHPGAANIGYQPEYVPVEICTHVIFKYFHFPKLVARQMLFDDNDKIAFTRLVTAVRKRSSTAQIIASIDGSRADFSRTSNTNVRRRAFTEAIASLLLELDADAIELNWDHPGLYNGGSSITRGVSTDRLTMVTLLQDLRQVVNAASGTISGRKRELWFRGSANLYLISTSYNVLEVCELVDHVTLESELITAQASHAPVRGDNASATTELPGGIVSHSEGYTEAAQAWIDDGCAPKKLLLGIGLGGVMRTLATSKLQNFRTYFQLYSIFLLGMRTNLAYRELCQMLHRNPEWVAGWDPIGLTPSALRMLPNGQTQRISYENVTSLRYKLDLVEQKRLGGVFADFIHSDDIYGSCGQAHPLSGYIAYRLWAIPSDIGFAIEWS